MPLPKDNPVGEIEPQATIAAQVTNAVPVKAYLTAKTGIKAADLTKEVWTKPEDIITNAVKAHGGTLEDYRNSGLG